MSQFHYPDLTGIDPLYRRTTDRVILTGNGQIITFPHPIYADSLTIESQLNGSYYQLVRDVDWIYTPDDIDVGTTSRLRVQDRTFDKVLVTQVRIVRSFPDEVATMQYQQLYPVDTVQGIYADSHPNLTPDVVNYLLTTVASLKQGAPLPSTIATAPLDARCLPLDIHGVSLDNIVEGERHVINTYDRQNLIRPVYGDYFPDTVRVTAVGVKELTRGVDWIQVACNVPLTSQTNRTDGVYGMILILYGHAGEIEIEYHAAGGQATVSDMERLKSAILDIRDYLSTRQFLDATTLSSTTVIQSMANRIQHLETNMRSLLSGTVRYDDSTYNSVRRHSIQTTDAQFHWFTIASLYRVEGSLDIPTADQCRLVIQTAQSRVQCDVTIAADVGVGGHPLSITAGARLVRDGIDPATGGMSLLPYSAIKFRIIWNDIDGGASGALLQIGMTAPSFTETLVVNDMSGQESCWILTPVSGLTIPADDAVTLPSGDTMWSVDSDFSRSAIAMLPGRHLLWAGSVSLVTLLTAPDVVVPNIPVGLIPTDVRSLLVSIDGTDGKSVLQIPMVRATDGSVSGMGIGAPISGDTPIAMLGGITVVDGAVTVAIAPTSAAMVGTITSIHAEV